MITVIKHGKETFKAICPICGCEFTYQSEDLKEDCFHNHYVDCPDCKQAVSHEYETKKKSIDPNILWDYAEKHKPDYNEYPDKLAKERKFYVDYQQPTIIWNSWPDCATCPNRPDPNKSAQVGDTPCTWCIKNRPYCGNGMADYATGPITVSPNLDKNTYTTGDPYLPKDLPTGATSKTIK